MLKNIIFDIGNVLLEYRWSEMLMDFGLSKEEARRVGTEIFHNPHWTILDLGTIDLETIADAYTKMYPEDAEAIRYFLYHVEDLHIVREDVWDRVFLLKEKGYKIYLLSNYPENLFEKHIEGTRIMDAVDGYAISSKVHHMKPQREIYDYLLNTYDLKAEECIFFDDREENTETAKKIGIDAITVVTKEDLLKRIDEILTQ